MNHQQRESPTHAIGCVALAAPFLTTLILAANDYLNPPGYFATCLVALYAIGGAVVGLLVPTQRRAAAVAGCSVLTASLAYIGTFPIDWATKHQPPPPAPPPRKADRFATENHFGSEWPFTVKEGRIYRDGQSVYFEASGLKYALNGTARQQPGAIPLPSMLWADDPQHSGLKKSLAPVIDTGLKL